MTLTVLKIFYKKKLPSIIRYRKCRNFDNELFVNDTENSISQEYSQNQFECLRGRFIVFLKKKLFLKKRYVKANQAFFMD